MAQLIISLDEGDKARTFPKPDERLQQRGFADVVGYLKASVADASAADSGERRRRDGADRNATDKPDRVHDAIFIDGARGTGKTAFILNLSAALDDETRKKLHFCSPIDPTLLDDTENFLNVIVAKLHGEAKERIEQGGRNTSYYEALEAVANAIESHNDGSELGGMERILARKNSIGLINRLDAFYAQVCSVLNCTVIVLPIDDIDMSFSKAFEILDVIRRYLASPLIVPVVTGDLRLYTHILNERFHQELVNKSAGSNFDSRELANQYLRKVLPSHRRTRLLTVPELITEHEIFVEHRNERLELRTLQHFLKHLIYLRTNGKESSHPDFLPTSTRGLIQFLLRIRPLIGQVKLASGASENDARVLAQTVAKDKEQYVKWLETLSAHWAGVERWPDHYRAQADLELINLKASRTERPLHDIVFFNALIHPKKISEYPWDHLAKEAVDRAKSEASHPLGPTLVAMPPLEPHSEHAIFAKKDVKALTDQKSRFLVSIFSHNNYYSTYQTTNLIFFGKAFEILITSFYRDLSPYLLNRILSEPPFHSSFSASQTKTLEAEAWEDEDEDEDEDEEGVTLDPPSSEGLDSFIQEVNIWRKEHVTKDSLVLPAQLVLKAMNKAFSLFVLLKTKDRMGNDTLSTVAERFRRIILSSFSSFEKNTLVNDSVVVLQNVGVEKRTDKVKIDEASFQQDPSYQINIRPLLADTSSVTYALSRHPLFAWVASTDGANTLFVKSATRRTNWPVKLGPSLFAKVIHRAKEDVQRAQEDIQRAEFDTTSKGDISQYVVSQRINKFLQPHKNTIIQAKKSDGSDKLLSEQVQNLIDMVRSEPTINQGIKPISPKNPEMYRLLLEAARKYGLESELESWRTS